VNWIQISAYELFELDSVKTTWKVPMHWYMHEWNQHVYTMKIDSVKTTWMMVIRWYLYVWNKHVYAMTIDSVKMTWKIPMYWYMYVWNKTCVRHENRPCEDDLEDADALIYVCMKQTCIRYENSQYEDDLKSANAVTYVCMKKKKIHITTTDVIWSVEATWSMVMHRCMYVRGKSTYIRGGKM